MTTPESGNCIAFSQAKRVANGSLRDVAIKVKDFLREHPKAQVLIFDEVTSQPVEIDFRGTKDQVLGRLPSGEISQDDAEKKPVGPGRPKLGVVAKEVTLLPQHWEWLGRQPGGASVTLRKLVDDAKKKNQARDQLRQAQEAAHKFMTAIAGDLPNYEEALRALYAKNTKSFADCVSDWPKDVRAHVLKLAKTAM